VPNTIVAGTPLPQMLIETHQNNDSVTVKEED
jgi:hypothetical protein